MLLDKTPNRAKFCGDRLKNAGDIRDRKFVLPEKVRQSSQKIWSNQLGDRGAMSTTSTTTTTNNKNNDNA